MIWSEALTQSARTLNEPEAATLSAPITGERTIPFFYKELIENWLLISGQALLRSVSVTALERVKSPALATASGGAVVGDFSELALNSQAVRLCSVVIDGGLTVEGSVAALYQRAKSTRTKAYSFADGKIRFKGTSAAVVYIKELELADWQGAATPILPEEYDDEWLFRTYEILSIIAKLPQYRI